MTDDSTRDRISAIGRVAILTSASEQCHDGYVEVTTADARMLLDEHGEVTEKLAIATKTVAQLAATIDVEVEWGIHFRFLEVDHTVAYPEEHARLVARTVSARTGRHTLVHRLVVRRSDDIGPWIEDDDPQTTPAAPRPHQERPAATPATDEPDERQFEPQQPAQAVRHFSPGHPADTPHHLGRADTCPHPACQTAQRQCQAADDIQDLTYEIIGAPQWTAENYPPIEPHILEGYRNALLQPPGIAHSTYYQIAYRLLREVERLEQELASAYTQDEDEHLTLRDVDPGYVYDCEEADRIADKFDERTGDDEQAPF